MLWVDSLQLHPHFKAILVLGSYLVLETKIKLQCKKMTDVHESRTIKLRELLGPGDCEQQVMLSAKLKFLLHRKTPSSTSLQICVLLLAGQGVPGLTGSGVQGLGSSCTLGSRGAAPSMASGEPRPGLQEGLEGIHQPARTTGRPWGAWDGGQQPDGEWDLGQIKTGG